jgi:hypothetical protein
MTYHLTMQNKTAFILGLMSGTLLLFGPLTVTYFGASNVTLYFTNPDSRSNMMPAPPSINSTRGYLLSTDGAVRLESGLMQHVIPQNGSMEEVSLLYRVDMETVKQRSIRGVNVYVISVHSLNLLLLNIMLY